VIFVESQHPPVVVGFVGGELARYHAFTMCLQGLNVPVGSMMYTGLGYDVAYNRNAVITHALKHPEVQAVEIWDDDHVFAPDTLLKLLDHNVDVVVPIYAQRQPPFRPCIYKEELDSGAFVIFSWPELEGKNGLIPVASAGAGGIVIKRHVLEALKDPWFERRGLIGEDHLFLKKCREAGFGVYCALDTPLGHLTPVEVWPLVNNANEWGVKVDLKGSPQQYVEFWDTKYQK